MGCNRTVPRTLPFRIALVLAAAAVYPVSVIAVGSAEAPEPSAGRDDVSVVAPGALPTSPPVARMDLPEEFLDQGVPGRAGNEFSTDFSRSTISFADVLSGGPPKDGIPAIDDPQFVSVEAAREWVHRREPVLVIESAVVARRDGEDDPLHDEAAAHIYPLQVLTWHEIVNDVVGGVPVTVTYCPLCNTGIAFDRRHHGAVLDFGTTGRLRFSNLIMYDRQTESWWQQASGDAVAGFFAGTRLRFVPVMMLSFDEAAEMWPEAAVLSRNTGFNRAYGSNPYVGYDSAERPFLFRPPVGGGSPSINGEWSLMERVVSLEHNGESTALAYPVLSRERVVEFTLGGERFAAIWEAGTASALDTARIAEGDDVGSANVFFARTTEGEPVELSARGGEVVDRATGSRWNAAGRAVDGPREGLRLDPAPGVQHFWFSHTALIAE